MERPFRHGRLQNKFRLAGGQALPAARARRRGIFDMRVVVLGGAVSKINSKRGRVFFVLVFLMMYGRLREARERLA